jgi:tape measure domain-containing protein
MQDSTVTITVTAIDGASKVFEGVGDTAVKQANRAANAWIKANDVQNVSIESTGQLGKAAGAAANQQDRLAASTRRSYFAQTALTTVLSAGINKAFLEMVDVTGQAINRVDLLAQFPASMTALGLSAADASVSLQKLSQYIGQIGGNLQDATTSVARFAEVTKDVKAATAEFIGVNNALIAGGAGSQVQANALEQLIQAYSRGIPQLIEWRSLMVAMPAQLNQVAKAMNLPNAQALGEALTNGKVSIQTFLTELTKLSTGTGPIANQALARMNGIQFAFNVFKNTLVEGMTSIIQTIGRQNIIDFFAVLTGVVKQLAVWAVQLISILFSLFNIVSRVFGGPQLKLAKDNTAGIADNLGGAADNAGDLADGLDDAAKAANKSLASFDKMNVLSKGTDSGKDKTPSLAGAPLSAADAAALDGIFGDINSKIGQIGTASKILAGILAGLAGIKFGQALLNQFNGLVDTFEKTAKNLKKVKDALKGTDTKTGLFDKAKESAKSFGGVLSTLGGFIAGLFGNSKFLGGVKNFSKALGGVLVSAIGAVIEGLALLGAIVAEILLLPEELALGVLIAIGAAVVAVIVGIGVLIAKNWDTIMNAIKVSAQAVWDFLVAGWNLLTGAVAAVWNTLYDIFSGPIKFLLQFWEAVITLVIAITAIFLQTVVGIFLALVKGIYDILSAVAGWIYDNVVTPIVNFFTAMWDAIVSVFRIAINLVLNNVVLPVVNWFNVNLIQPILNFFIGLWNAITYATSTFFNGVKALLTPFASWIYDNIIRPIAGFFSGLWDGIKNGLSSMINGLASIFGSIGDIVKVPLNGIIDIINNFLAKFVSIKVPDWVPSFGGKKVEFPKIPKLATGGIVDQPTLAQVGENGGEAIVPLENNLEWLDRLADKINSTSGNGQPLRLTVQIGEDQIISKVIELINEKTQMSGRNTILV